MKKLLLATALLLPLMSPVYAQMVDDGNSTEQTPKAGPDINATNPAPVQHNGEQLFTDQPTLAAGKPTFVLNATRVTTCMTIFENLSRLDMATAVTLQLDNNIDSSKYLEKAKLEDQMSDATLAYGVEKLLVYATANHLEEFSSADTITSLLTQASQLSSQGVVSTMINLLGNGNGNVEELTMFVQKNHDFGDKCKTFMNTYVGGKGFIVPKPE